MYTYIYTYIYVYRLVMVSHVISVPLMTLQAAQPPPSCATHPPPLAKLAVEQILGLGFGIWSFGFCCGAGPREMCSWLVG